MKPDPGKSAVLGTLPSCPLCGQPGRPFQDGVYHECPDCRGLFLAEDDYLDAEEEKARYEEHNNDVHDAGYQAFVSPIVERVLSEQAPSHKGLDFGSGTAPVIAHLLHQEGYSVACYDPFFSPKPELLNAQYDYIVCCEVIEHFHDPAAEFARLKAMLKPGGQLYCMTLLYDDGIDFLNWHYRRDPTHVFIYQRDTIEWIAREFGFSQVAIGGRLLVFETLGPSVNSRVQKGR